MLRSSILDVGNWENTSSFLGDLRRICEEYQKRIVAIENAKYDIEKEVDKKAYKIDELNIAVSDLRGKL